MSYYNWKPVAESLFRHLQAAGATITHVNDGGGWIKTPTLAAAVDAATGVDEAHVRVTFVDHLSSCLWIVYGNSPEELVADYTYNLHEVVLLLEPAIEQFQAEWEDKPCPMCSEAA